MSGIKSPVDETTTFKIQVQSQDGSIIIFQVPTGMVMERIFMSYSRIKQIIDYNTVQFLFDGNRISPKMTIDELGLKDGDLIDAMLPQDGGGSVI